MNQTTGPEVHPQGAEHVGWYSMHTLLDASVALHARGDLDEVLARAAAAARELAGATGACVLWLPESEDEGVRLATSSATPADTEARARTVAEQAGPVISASADAPWAGVPVRVGGMAHGAILVFLAEPDSSLDVSALETLASLTASGARNAFLMGQLRARTRRGDEILLHTAHEFRRPLTTLATNLELLDEEVPDSVRIEALDRIRHAVDDMRDVTDDVLSYERLVAGRMPTAPFDLAASVRDAAAVAAGGRVQWDGPKPLIVAGDERLVGAAVRNLIENAVKYSPRDRQVAISWKRDGDWARVSVRDEGPGITLGDQTRIFEPFQRLQAASGVPGMGLGLSLVKAVAEGHGGHVTVESVPGAGSKFTLHLPVG